MAIQIKRADVSDAAALQQLNEAFNENGMTVEMIAASLRAGRKEIIFIAYVDAQPAGFICGAAHQSIWYKSLYGAVEELYVSEGFRRQGIAAALIDALEAEFRTMGVAAVFILTGAGNHAAQAAYAKGGYEGYARMEFRKNL